MADAKNAAAGTRRSLSGTHVVMGRIGAAYGIKGWVKLLSFTDPATNLLDHRHYFITDDAHDTGADSTLQQVEIDEARPQGKGFVGHIKGCDVREETRRYTGRDLLLPRDELPPLEDGFYWYQLEGLRVVNLAGEDFGIVDHLLETGANDVLVVRGDAASIDQEERLLPYLPGKVVMDVDLQAGLLRVDWEKDY